MPPRILQLYRAKCLHKGLVKKFLAGFLLYRYRGILFLACFSVFWAKKYPAGIAPGRV